MRLDAWSKHDQKNVIQKGEIKKKGATQEVSRNQKQF